jgi:hypothetical protein
MPGSPRVTRAMIDLLYAVASCGEVVGSWEVSGQPGGLVVRARTRETFDSEPLATEAGEQMAKCVLPGGFEIGSSTVSARAEGHAGDRWRGVAELVVVPPE